MKPGPTRVLKCPTCGAVHQQLTFLSGNSYGARRWTDGRIDAPMHPMPTRFVRCEHCRGFFFIEDAEAVGEIPTGPGSESISDSWKNAPRVLWPEVEDYRDALKHHADGGDPERERYLRIHLWWAINDALSGRLLPSFKDPRIDAGLDDDRRKEYEKLLRNNLDKLLKLLDQNMAKDRIIKAEIYRETGRFKEAAACLEGVESEEMGIAISEIRSLIEHKQSKVSELPLL